MKRVAVCAPGEVGPVMASPTIRAYQLARSLEDEFEVTLVAPTDAATYVDQLARFDAVLAQRLPASVMKWLARSRLRVIYDLYTPVLPEALASLRSDEDGRRARLAANEVALQQLALVTGNAFICAGERQRDFWIGALGSLDRVELELYREDPMLRNLVDVVPFGVPEQPPHRRGRGLRDVVPQLEEGDRILLWAGGIVAWTDPKTVIRAVARVAANRPEVKVVFLGADPPDAARPRVAAEAISLAASAGLVGENVHFVREWVPYDERGGLLLDSHVGIAAYTHALESRLAYRARLVDYFWAGLPTITTRGDELGDLVERRGLGRALRPGDVDGWVAAIHDVLDDPAAMAERAREFGAAQTWPRVVGALRRLLRVEGAPIGRSPASLRLELNELRAHAAVAISNRVEWAARHRGRARRARSGG